MPKCLDGIITSLAVAGLVFVITAVPAIVMRIDLADVYFYYVMILPPIIVTTYARLCLLEEGETSVVKAFKKKFFTRKKK